LNPYDGPLGAGVAKPGPEQPDALSATPRAINTNSSLVISTPASRPAPIMIGQVDPITF
jgi:hypothetical protein